MSTEVVIRVNSISKKYRLYDSKYDFIKEAIHPFRRKYHSNFNALKDVSFTAKKGEVIGVIGQNGSGKSTLLKILASVVTPTSGSFSCRGKVTALLELGGGFNRDLTGIQNIRFLGALQGYSKDQLDAITKKVLDFANIGKYAHQTVNTYSSGMYVRLAFSISININPDILIIDEALAVGDIRFQQKCYRKIQEFKDEGKTIVMCTHSLEAVNNFCNRAIWLQNGEIRAMGKPSNITEHYKAFMMSSEIENPTRKKTEHKKTVVPSSKPIKVQELSSKYSNIKWYDLDVCESFGSKEKYIKYASIISAETNENIKYLLGGEAVRVLLYIKQKKKVENVGVHLLLTGKFGSTIFRINSSSLKSKFVSKTNTSSIVEIDFNFPHISNGRYTLSAGILTLKNKTKEYIHWVHDAILVEVSNPDTKYKMDAQVVIDDIRINTHRL